MRKEKIEEPGACGTRVGSWSNWLDPLPLVFVELARSAWFDRYKIQPKVKNFFSDMFCYYIDIMKMFILVVGPLQLVSYLSIQVTHLSSPLPWNQAFPSPDPPPSCSRSGRESS
uniref:Uncharacterized protein n=1 Tax=Brassica campestris TaxID=3711 RepID=M4DRX6_BRACM